MTMDCLNGWKRKEKMKMGRNGRNSWKLLEMAEHNCKLISNWSRVLV